MVGVPQSRYERFMEKIIDTAGIRNFDRPARDETMYGLRYTVSDTVSGYSGVLVVLHKTTGRHISEDRNVGGIVTAAKMRHEKEVPISILDRVTGNLQLT